jgi:hypothetical protein
MSAVWIGFLGVIVGGLITTIWSWLAVVRQELSDAMVSARLVYEDLANLDEVLRVTSSAAGPAIDADIWEQNRGSLARVLGREQWDAVSAVYRRYSSPVPEETLLGLVFQAQNALQELADGKRYVIPQRWRNAAARLRNSRPENEKGTETGKISDQS